MKVHLALAVLAGLWTLPQIPMCNVYKGDVERMCDAEQRSGRSVKTDLAGVMSYMEHDVATAEAVTLAGELEAESPKDRAVHLRSEARKQALASCPLADALQTYASVDAYKSAVSSLCHGEAVSDSGEVARLDVAPADDAERIREIREWTQTNLKGSGLLEFVDRLGQTPVQGRAALLRAEAGRVGAGDCPLAAVLEKPPPTPISVTPVSLPSYSVIQVEASGKARQTVASFLGSGDAAQVIDTCYGQALVKSQNLAGTLGLRLSLDAKGAITKAEESASTLSSPGVVKCITSGLAGVVVGPPQDRGGSPKCSATLLFAPVRGAPTPGWPSAMPTYLTVTQDAGPPINFDGGVDAGAPRRKKR